MKKILAISVAFMYLAITSGLVLQIHYCMGEQVSTSIKLADIDTHQCSKCGMQNTKNKCCHDDVKIIKLRDVHNQATSDFQVLPGRAIEKEFNWINPLLQLSGRDATGVCNNSPPDDDIDLRSLFLLHGVFRI